MINEPTDANTIPKLLLRNAERLARKPAFGHKRLGIWRITTWSVFATQVEQLASVFDAFGLTTGGAVAVFGDNRPELYQAMLAAQALGGIAVPIAADATPEAVATVVRATRPIIAVVEGQEQLDKFLRNSREIGVSPVALYLDRRGLRDGGIDGVLWFETAMAEGSRHLGGLERGWLARRATNGCGSDPASVLTTAGGRLVTLTHDDLLHTAKATAETFAVTASDRLLAFSPLHSYIDHGFSYVLANLCGCQILCPENLGTLLENMQECGPTVLAAPGRFYEALARDVVRRMRQSPSFLRQMFESGSRRKSWLCRTVLQRPLGEALGLSRLRVALATGEPVAETVIAAWTAIGIPIRTVYGCTEVGGVLAMSGAEERGRIPLDAAFVGFQLRVGDGGDLEASRIRPEGNGEIAWISLGDMATPDAATPMLVGRADEAMTEARASLVSIPVIEARLRARPEIRDAFVTFDKRGKLAALVLPDEGSLAVLAERRGLPLSSLDHVGEGWAIEAVAAAVAAVNRDLSSDGLAGSRLRAFAVTTMPIVGEAIMATGRLDRARLLRQYADLIAELRGHDGPDVHRTWRIPESCGLLSEDSFYAAAMVRNLCNDY